MVDPKAHQLYKSAAYANIGFSTTPGSSAVIGDGWTMYQPGATPYFIHRTYIDLQGWTDQQLTMFTQGVDIQKGIMPLLGGSKEATGVREFDFITTRKLQDTECAVYLNIPGSIPSTVSQQELIYGEFVEYGRNNTITNTFIKTNFETLGSGNPTAMDKLHWTRVYYWHIAGNGDTLLVDNANLVVQAMTVEEKDLVWMERLRRSYVLQNEIV